MNISEVVERLNALVDNGRCSVEDSLLALGAWSTWHHHPSLREDMFDGTVDMEKMALLLREAGVEVPWPAAEHGNDRSKP